MKNKQVYTVQLDVYDRPAVTSIVSLSLGEWSSAAKVEAIRKKIQEANPQLTILLTFKTLPPSD